MKTYYCVVNSYDNKGKVKANIADIIEAEEKPKDEYMETKRADIYYNWFDNRKEAENFIKQCKQA